MVPHNAYLLVFVFRLGFHTSLLPTYRPIPTDILPLVSSYIHGPIL